MKSAFEFTLRGQDWSRLYYWYWGPLLLLTVLNWISPGLDFESVETAAGPLALAIAIAFLEVLVQSFFTVPILRTWLPRLSVDGKAFSFAGDTNDYLLLNVKGFLLTVVTVGIYSPWYTRDVLAYLAAQTTFEGHSAKFTGRPARLLANVALAFLAIIVVTTVIILAVALAVAGLSSTELVLTGVTFFVIILALGPVLYLVYAWMVQFTWHTAEIRWNTKLWPASTVILGQFALTVLSLGIWWPGATLVLYRYFVARTEVKDSLAGTTRFVFEGKIGEGFGVLWVQTLLTLVTLGFYGAWSGPNVTRWVAERTFAIRES